ncbi:hypothetical protein [Deinococcus gobiensis]|uniref:Uncharacterized protein n=1 Tax=Deinococcus gobiensis (strain DSM 21396 / JCM 16679 / CGMCC 1.7299 / I-0) TaxID=745776 RepID=H8H1X3_DEIGI|nr:hypothetical protein [Deinococcus gobiensis]AFD27520.1 hypothetical protein DGo_PB0251 [Deinococcus gobiensis I-0]
MRPPPRPRFTFPVLSPSRGFLITCALVALPFLAALGWRLSLNSQERAHLHEACQAFVRGSPGWQTRAQIDTQLNQLDLEIRAAAATSYEQVKADFARTLTPDTRQTYRLHALPIYQNLNWRQGVQQFIGQQIRLSSDTLPHSAEGSPALFVQLPFDPGSTNVLQLETPCGRYRQTFFLSLSPEQRAQLVIRTTGPGLAIPEQSLLIDAP